MSDYAVINPATGETLKTYSTIGDPELQAAIGNAGAAHRALASSTTAQTRAAVLRRVG
jgi:succinate-semialdehyde dehydrogenase / glutarate-semialdehyde dehydrogenase